jgi:Domain of unknown function (DUF5666)
MMKRVLKIGGAALLALAIAGLPVQLSAQTNDKPAVAKKPAGEKKETSKSEKKQSSGPFRGKLAELDKTAKTITVGTRTFQITSATKIFKAGKPATLEDGVVGEIVSGGFKTAEDGKLVATKVTFGPAAPEKSGEKKKEKSDKATDKSPAPPAQ